MSWVRTSSIRSTVPGGVHSEITRTQFEAFRCAPSTATVSIGSGSFTPARHVTDVAGTSR